VVAETTYHREDRSQSMSARKNRLVSVYVDQAVVDMMLATRARTGWALSEQVRLAVDAWLASQERSETILVPRAGRRRRRSRNKSSAVAPSKKSRGRTR